MKKYVISFKVAFSKAVFAWVLLGLIGTWSLRAQNTPLNDSNFNTARDLWFSKQAQGNKPVGLGMLDNFFIDRSIVGNSFPCLFRQFTKSPESPVSGTHSIDEDNAFIGVFEFKADQGTADPLSRILVVEITDIC